MGTPTKKRTSGQRKRRSSHFALKAKRLARLARHRRVRKKVSGTSQKPRLCVYRSLKHIYAQLIDDAQGATLASASTLSPDYKKMKLSAGSNKEAAEAVGRILAGKALEKGIQSVVFDKNGYRYHGRIRALADAVREKGLQF